MAFVHPLSGWKNKETNSINYVKLIEQEIFYHPKICVLKQIYFHSEGGENFLLHSNSKIFFICFEFHDARFGRKGRRKAPGWMCFLHLDGEF
jgi:hypothetical protein